MEYAVEIENLSFSYPDGSKALDGINLSIPVGQSLAIIGPNGAGKSTLLLHLNGILSNNSTVKILGLPTDSKNIKWIRSKVGMVFQDPNDQLFSPTIFDDIAFGPINMGCPEPEVKRRVAQALHWVGMTGYDDRSSHHLSLGEKKRISIATVLSMSPQILALDEPTANLDPRSKWDLIDLLLELPMTKIIATHDLESVDALCERTVILDRGKVVADDMTRFILGNVQLLQSHSLAPVKRLSVPVS